MAKEKEVQEASNTFYNALNQMVNGNAEALKAIWSHSGQVSTMHPVGGRQIGWDEVWNTWDQVALVSSEGKVVLKDQVIRVEGSLAYETGTEDAEFKIAGNKAAGAVRVTNIYRNEDGNWKIVHHHTDLAPEMVEVLKKIQAR